MWIDTGHPQCLIGLFLCSDYYRLKLDMDLPNHCSTDWPEINSLENIASLTQSSSNLPSESRVWFPLQGCGLSPSFIIQIAAASALLSEYRRWMNEEVSPSFTPLWPKPYFDSVIHGSRFLSWGVSSLHLHYLALWACTSQWCHLLFFSTLEILSLIHSIFPRTHQPRKHLQCPLPIAS